MYPPEDQDGHTAKNITYNYWNMCISYGFGVEGWLTSVTCPAKKKKIVGSQGMQPK